MADALASGASVRKDVGVQVPPRAPKKMVLPLIGHRMKTAAFILAADFIMNQWIETRLQHI